MFIWFLHASVCRVYWMIYVFPDPHNVYVTLCSSYCINNLDWPIRPGLNISDWWVSVYTSPDTLIQPCTKTDTQTQNTSVPYDSGQVYLVFSWVWSMREEGIPHSPSSTWKTLGTRLTHTEPNQHLFLHFCFEMWLLNINKWQKAYLNIVLEMTIRLQRVSVATCSCHWPAHKDSSISFPLRTETLTVSTRSAIILLLTLW